MDDRDGNQRSGALRQTVDGGQQTGTWRWGRQGGVAAPVGQPVAVARGVQTLGYDPSCRIFVPFDAPESSVYGVMKRVAGSVRAVTIPRDAATGVGAGYAFVDFADAASVATALAAPPHELELLGRALRVSLPNRQYGVLPGGRAPLVIAAGNASTTTEH